MPDVTTAAPPTEERIAKREGSMFDEPFGMLDRFADEMDRLFADFGVGRGWLSPRFGTSWMRRPFRTLEKEFAWTPQIEVFHKNGDLVVRADLPGLKKDDVKVDITEDMLTIQGERKQEEKEEREGFYRSERSYGSFYRAIPLPEGTITEKAKANFKDGVLEIIVPAPPAEAQKGRRLEIAEPAAKK